MSAPHRQRVLEQALAELPETLIGEIIFGRLVTQPRPAIPHAQAATALTEILGPPFRRGIGGPGGWIILFEPEIALGPHVLVPDLAGWRRDTVPELEPVPRMHVRPDWVCEILSAGTEARDRDEKMRIYGANDVGFLWLVDVTAKTVEVHVSDRGRWHEAGRFTGDDDASIAPFDAVPLPLARLWAR